MKKPTFLIPLFVLGLSVALVAQFNRHALLVGINYFQQKLQATALSGENDLSLVNDALIQQFFAPNNIIKLAGKDANLSLFKQNIELLINRCQAGDIVLLHLSTHGFQIQDDDADEIDGFDEALAFYDIEGNDQQIIKGFIRDDAFARYIQAIRAKLGPAGQLICVLDACYSAGLNRGNQTPTKSFESNAYWDLGKLPLRNTDGIAPCLFISSSPGNASTKNLQHVPYSALSYAFSKHFPLLKSNTTFKGFFDELSATVAALNVNQQPQMAGDPNTVLLLGNKKNITPNVFAVEKTIGSLRVQVSGGEMALHAPGEEFIFLPVGLSLSDTTFNKPLIKGKITETALWSSFVQLDRPATVLNTWAHLHRQQLIKDQATLSVNIPDPLKVKELELALGVKKFSTNPSESQYQVNQSGNNIVLLDHTRTVFFSVLSSAPDWANKIRLALFNHRQSALLRALESHDPNIVPEFTVELASFKPLNAPNAPWIIKQKTPIEAKRDAIGIKLSANRDTLILSVKNQGTADFYFTILDVQPNHVINFLAPFPEENDFTNYFIKSGQVKTLPYPIEIYPPTGREFFILIASRKPLSNLPQILNNQITRTLEQASALEYLLSTNLDPQIWDGSDYTKNLIQPNQTTIKKITFTIE